MAIQLPARIALTSALVAARIARIAFDAAAAAFFTVSTELFAAALARCADTFAALTVVPELTVVRVVRSTVRTERLTGFTARLAVFIDRLCFSRTDGFAVSPLLLRDRSTMRLCSSRLNRAPAGNGWGAIQTERTQTHGTPFSEKQRRNSKTAYEGRPGSVNKNRRPDGETR